MHRIAKAGMITICAGAFVIAQEQTRTETQTTTWNGRLVDAACQSSHTEHREVSTTKNPDSVTTRTETTRTDTVCPVTSTTTSYGLVTRDGRFIRFDNPSNARVSQMVRDNQTWNQSVANSRPLQVEVMGTPNGDVAVVQSITPGEGGPPPTGEAERVAGSFPPEQSYDVRMGGDKGRLIIGRNNISFEDLSNDKHSRTWSYAQIRELKRDSGKEIKIQPYSGDKYELHLVGSSDMADDVYRTIGDRIIAARGH